MSESRQTHVTLHDIDPQALDQLVQFAYTAEIVVGEGNVQVRPPRSPRPMPLLGLRPPAVPLPLRSLLSPPHSVPPVLTSCFSVPAPPVPSPSSPHRLCSQPPAFCS